MGRGRIGRVRIERRKYSSARYTPMQPLIVIPDESPMFHSIHMIACTYAHSGTLLERHGDTCSIGAFLFPAVVCQSFAIELFLKFFLVVDHPSIISKEDLVKHNINFKPKGSKGHGYSALWDMIQPHHQTKIAAKAKVGIRGFRQLLLDIGDDPFVQWRYVHEERDMKMLPLELIKQVTDALGYSAQDLMNSLATAKTPKV